MDIVKAAVISVCFTAIAVGIIETLLPNNSFLPQLRLLTGTILIISMITPFYALTNVEIPDVTGIYDLSGTVSADALDTLQAAAAAAAKTEIGEILKQYDIENAEIKIFTTINEDESIQISKAEISVDAADIDFASEAIKQIKTQLNINAFVAGDNG